MMVPGLEQLNSDEKLLFAFSSKNIMYTCYSLKIPMSLYRKTQKAEEYKAFLLVFVIMTHFEYR